MDETPSIRVRPLATAIIVATGMVYALREAADLFTPLLVSILLAYALAPFVDFFVRGRLPRSLAVILVYLVVGTLAATAVSYGRYQLEAIAGELPQTVGGIARVVGRSMNTPARRSPLNRLQSAADDLQAAIDAAGPKPSVDIVRVVPVQRFRFRDYVANASSAILGAGARMLVIAVLTFVLLIAGGHARRKIVAIAGRSFEQRMITLDILRAIDEQIERYFVARILISAIVATATGAGLWAIGMRHAFVLGVVAGVLNVLPFIGPSIAVIVSAVMAYLQFRSPQMAAAALGISGLVAALEGNLISPWLTSRAGEVNTVAVFISVLSWGWMWDVWGLVLAVPIIVSVKAAADHIEPLQPLGELLGR
jgi:predicted PurR-regulated permease PerM